MLLLLRVEMSLRHFYSQLNDFLCRPNELSSKKSSASYIVMEKMLIITNKKNVSTLVTDKTVGN